MMNYKEALVEVDEILNMMSESDVKKIPADIIKAIKSEKSSSYQWKYDYSKNLQDQSISKEAIAILCYLNLEYMVTKEQKEGLKKIYEYNERKNK